MLIFIVVDASGRGPDPHHRLGWGISQEIDPRLLDVSFQSKHGEPLRGWAADGRSAGIAIWQNPNVQLTDHPQQALLGGRIPLHDALIKDLNGAHRARYRRDDGTWGGWVHQLAEWQVQAIFVPVEREQLCRDLQKTTWNALDIDSPTVPFVSTDDLQYSDAFLDAMRKECFVEVGPWQPGLEIYDSMEWRYDVMELLGAGPDPAPAIRQSQRFRSMNIPMASLRALLPVRASSHSPALWDEFQKCQNALAHQEWLTFGDASYFRKLVANTLALKLHASEVPWPAVRDSQEPADLWDRCIQLYLQGNIADAAKSLPCTTPEQNFAAAMLRLEFGETDRVAEFLQPLLVETADGPLLIAAKYWTEQIGLFQGL